MRIAYITTGNIFMNSSANIRNIAIVKGLEMLGHEVRVVCFENYKETDSEFAQILGSVDVRCIGKDKVQEKANFIKENNSAKKKLVSKIKKIIHPLYKKIQVYDPYKHGISEISEENLKWDEYDLVISSSDPKSSHLLVYNARKAGYKFRWVQYWGDPMTLDLTLKTWVSPLLRHEERKLFKEADKIVFTNTPSTEAMKKKYPEYESKFMDIPTSIYENTPVRTKCDFDVNSVSIGYYGGCSSVNRNIRPLVATAQKNLNTRLTVAGGNDIGLTTNGNVTVYGRVSYEKVKEMTADTDILVVLENFPKNNDVDSPCCQIPGKMYHYALMRKPVLVICETKSLKKEFEKYGVYYFCENNENSIEKAIKDIVEDLANKKEYEVVEEFSPQNVAEKLISLI